MNSMGMGISPERVYRRVMLQKAVDLSKKHGGLKRIPSGVLLENGIRISRKGRATAVTIIIPDSDTMEDRINDARAEHRPAMAEEAGQFKLSPEPPLIQTSQDAATMEDFWIEQGWYKVERNGWRLLKGVWKDEEATQISAVRFLVENVLQKDPRDATQGDFYSNRLGGLLVAYFSGSPYRAVSIAFPEQGIRPWEMNMVPNNYFETKENRVAAVKWLVKKVRKDIGEITKEDFESNGLCAVLNQHGNSPYKAIAEAYPELKPWEMKRTPKGFFKIKENRVAAVRWMVGKLGKDPRDIIKRDFSRYNMQGILHHHSHSPHAVITEAFPELDIKPWEMRITPQGFYKEKKNRIAAIKWLVEKSGKDPEEIGREDFISNGLEGLLYHYYGGNPKRALSELDQDS